MRRPSKAAEERESFGAVGRIACHLETQPILEKLLQKRSKLGIVIGQEDAVWRPHAPYLQEGRTRSNPRKGPF